MRRNLLLARAAPAALCFSLIVAPTPAAAQQPGSSVIQLPSMDLSKALRAVAMRTGRNIVAPDPLVRGLKAPPLKGDYTAEEAVILLLKGSGLTYTIIGGDLVISKSAQVAASPATIVVTGTRIRGAPIASTVIELTQEQLRESGQATLADAVRTIPQNFGGGQNPGVGNNVPATSGVNVGSATSVNLRGLGSDATLTLLNGHRLSYSASRQAIDISSIPLDAVDRIEIVPDGASALYGSDAVAGVVNVILKRDYQGLEVEGRLGTSSDGGDFERRYGLVTGSRWGSGGIIATYEYGRTTAILGRERSYTAKESPGLTLFPFIRQHNLLVSAHQDLAPAVTVQVDALYNNRFSDNAFALNSAGDLNESGIRIDYRSNSLVIAPTLRFLPGGDWNLFLTGSYGRDHTHYDVTSFVAGKAYTFGGNCYCNSARSAEAGGDGTLFRGPAGPVRLAIGAGYRSNSLVRFNGAGAATNISKSQASYYAYGELSLPLVSSAQGVRLARSLSLSAALRWERYPHIGAIGAPKVGVIYEPTRDVSLKASWGRSFRAPTLYQQYSASDAVLGFPADFGGSGFAAGTTALLFEGGNPNLKPERATSWSTTVQFQPASLAGAHLELSYFDTRYRDRVVTPIAFLNQALTNPIYADRLTFDPGSALVEQIIANATYFANTTGSPFDSGSVAVLIDNRNINAAYQKIRGLDLMLADSADLAGDGGTLRADVDATYLDSSQRLGPGQPIQPLAGILFNPPHWRARGELSWSTGPAVLTGDVNFVGGVTDTRHSPAVHVRGLTTFDLTLLLRSASQGLEGAVTIQNLFNAKPARIATSLPIDAPYDSTNYSPVGRFIAVSLRKRW